MIIFDLACLANDEHRRHFIDPLGDHPDYYRRPCESCKNGSNHKIDLQHHKITGEPFQPDYKAYNEACDKDEPVEPVIEMMDGVYQNNIRFYQDIQIWTDRPESMREKTTEWLCENILWDNLGSLVSLKMRPIDDTSPQEVLFEEWLDHIPDATKMIEFVFSAHKPTIEMFRRRGVFVFDCNQGE